MSSYEVIKDILETGFLRLSGYDQKLYFMILESTFLPEDELEVKFMGCLRHPEAALLSIPIKKLALLGKWSISNTLELCILMNYMNHYDNGITRAIREIFY